jgi:tRNA dimethylallyltransferase
MKLQSFDHKEGTLGEKNIQGLILAGPTASGKSAFALALTEHLKGHIINADSIQLYAGLPILTAQPSGAEKARAPHHLYEVLPSSAPVISATHWLSLADEAITQVQTQKGFPILVGGAGFYFYTLLNGLSPVPSVPFSIREKLEMQSTSQLFEQLKKIDPTLAHRLMPQDKQRIVRALSVYQATGTPLSLWQQKPRLKSRFQFQTILLSPPKGWLDEQIERRLEQMLLSGALDEVDALQRRLTTEELMQAGVTRALGFHEIVAYLKGELSQAGMREKIFFKTRRYAKRQATWFRHQIKPIDTFNPQHWIHTKAMHEDVLTCLSSLKTRS